MLRIRDIPRSYPLYSRAGYATISAGLWTYDRMARVLKEERNQMLSRDETLATEPLLRPDKIYGAGLYYECITDDARLVIDTGIHDMGVQFANGAALSIPDTVMRRSYVSHRESIEAAMRTIEGAARSLGLDVTD